MTLLKTVSLEKSSEILKWSYTFQRLFFILPVFILFYQYKGASVGDLFLLNGILALSIFLLEIPTGYMGDFFSRKKVMIASLLFTLLTHFIWIAFNGIFVLILAQIFLGIAVSLYSGTSEAYLYDVLKLQKKEKSIVKVQGKITAYSLYGTGISTLLGGAIYYLLGPMWIVIIETCFVLLSLILIAYLPDLKISARKKQLGVTKFKDMLNIIKYAGKHKDIKWLILLFASFGSGAMILAWYQQPLMTSVNIPVAMFGVFICFHQIFRGFLSHSAHCFLDKLKKYNFSLLLISMLFGAFLLPYFIISVSNIHLQWFLLLIFGLCIASFSSLRVVIFSLINHRTKSAERATTLSVANMAFQLFNAIGLFGVKFLLDIYGMQNSIFIIAPIILFLVFASMRKLIHIDV